MRATATCPKCSGKKMMVVTTKQITGQYANKLSPIPVVGYEVARLLTTEPRTFGRFEAWICIACGFTEHYAEDLGDVDVAALAAAHPDVVRLVDGSNPEKAPFR
jgi:predicted nucleic-acid-binding Zn-ribbon protein